MYEWVRGGGLLWEVGWVTLGVSGVCDRMGRVVSVVVVVAAVVVAACGLLCARWWLWSHVASSVLGGVWPLAAGIVRGVGVHAPLSGMRGLRV